MKAILEIPEREISFEFDNVSVDEFRMVCARPYKNIPMIVEKFTDGKPITLVTSNMPEPLKAEIIKMIARYCGH